MNFIVDRLLQEVPTNLMDREIDDGVLEVIIADVQ